MRFGVAGAHTPSLHHSITPSLPLVCRIASVIVWGAPDSQIAETFLGRYPAQFVRTYRAPHSSGKRSPDTSDDRSRSARPASGEISPKSRFTENQSLRRCNLLGSDQSQTRPG